MQDPNVEPERDVLPWDDLDNEDGGLYFDGPDTDTDALDPSAPTDDLPW